jgi:hypothetical protein
MSSVRLGSWRCRSGNSVDLYIYEASDDPLRHLVIAWDSPPPLSDEDLEDYRTFILSAVVKRVQEYLELPGPALVLL